jgi:RNA 2',3'-cyclic 3'-phosphodiesterase
MGFSLRHKLMSIRAFIAFPVPSEVISSLRANIVSYKNEIPESMIRWVPELNIHLTLKFIGEVSPEVVKSVAEDVGEQITGYSSFTIRLDHLGAFPNLHHPQVVWVGGKTSEELSLIQNKIELITREYGIPHENRPFSPHFTIGRVARDLNENGRLAIRTFLEKNGSLNMEPIRASEIAIIQSELRPSGAVYTDLYRFALSRVTDLTN